MVVCVVMLIVMLDVDKVVFFWLIDIIIDVVVDSGVLLEWLVVQNLVSYNFYVLLVDGGVLLGVSFELLLCKEGEWFSLLLLVGLVC